MEQFRNSLFCTKIMKKKVEVELAPQGKFALFCGNRKSFSFKGKQQPSLALISKSNLGRSYK